MSNCGWSFSKEQIVNNKRNPVGIITPSLNQTADETRAKLKALKDSVQIIDDKYHIFGDAWVVKTRISEWAKRKAGGGAFSVNKDNDVRRVGGTHAHAIYEDLLNYYWQNKTSDAEYETIKKKAANGPVKIGSDAFNELEKAAEYVVNDIRRLEKEKDPTGKIKATLHTENFVMDFIEDVGGTIDVIAVFDDNTAAVYDLKTTGKGDVFGEVDRGLTPSSPLPYTEHKAYNFSQGRYAEVLKDRIGVTVIRNRLIPAAIQYKMKPRADQSVGDTLLPEISRLITVGTGSKSLKPIPTGGEQAKQKGITQLIEKQMEHQARLVTELKKGSKTFEQKEKIKARIKAIDSSIINTLVDEDIDGIATTMDSLLKDIDMRIGEPELTKKNEPNPNYLNNEDLDNFLAEALVYSDIVNQTHRYFADMKKANPEKYKKLRERIGKSRDDLEQAALALKTERLNRIESKLSAEYKDDEGHILPTTALSAAQLHALKVSEIDDPVFQLFWKTMSKTNLDVKKKFLDMEKKVWPVTDALFKWAKDNIGGVDARTQAYKMLYNEETGLLHEKLDRKAWDKLQLDIKEGGAVGIKAVSEAFDFKNRDKWEAEYKPRLEAYKKERKLWHNNFQDSTKDGKVTLGTTHKKNYEKDVLDWIERNDLVTSKAAWLIDYNRRAHLKLKKEFIVKNASAEYKRISQTKELLDFYEMWNDYMEEFAAILGIESYSQLPPNFIPNIRKEIVEYIGADNINFVGAAKEMFEAFSVREEDIYRGERGQQEKTIPILFMNKFFTKDKQVDNTRKSYDLAKSLMIFGRMAYNYEAMSKIESDVMAMKMLIKDPTPEQGGIQATDRMGRKIPGRVQDFVKEQGVTSSNTELFSDLADAYLYGIKFKEKSLLKSIDTVHVGTKLKAINSSLKLGLAVVPAGGAFVAGKIGSILTGNKGILYDNEQFIEAWRLARFEHKKYENLTEFFDAQNDDYVERALVKFSAAWKNRYLTDRTLFYPLRRVDKAIVNQVLTAMAQNFGVKEDGTVFRFTSFGKKKGLYKDTKSIIDLMEVDKDGKVSIKGLSEEGYLQFRIAVKAGVAEIIGNMDPDDMGKMDVAFWHNQAFSFKSWIPAIVNEYAAELHWDEKTQAMKWGRFRALLSDYARSNNIEAFSAEEMEYGKALHSYLTNVFVPAIGNTVIDLMTFGIAPAQTLAGKFGWERINMERARRQYDKFLVQNPKLRGTVTFEHFLEIKEGQIKTALMQIRLIVMLLVMSGWLGGDDKDGNPRYMANFVTRFGTKVLHKGASELTFMWNPSEFGRLLKNPFPTAQLLIQLQKTAGNMIDEVGDVLTGRPDSQDNTPPLYFMAQWIKGGSQLARFLEVFESMKENPYSVLDISTN